MGKSTKVGKFCWCIGWADWKKLRISSTTVDERWKFFQHSRWKSKLFLRWWKDPLDGSQKCFRHGGRFDRKESQNFLNTSGVKEKYFPIRWGISWVSPIRWKSRKVSIHRLVSVKFRWYTSKNLWSFSQCIGWVSLIEGIFFFFYETDKFSRFSVGSIGDRKMKNDDGVVHQILWNPMIDKKNMRTLPSTHPAVA